MQQEIITAMDFGSNKISLSVAIKDEEGIRILASKSYGSLGIEKGLIKNTIKCRDSVVSLLTDLEKKLGININDINIGISSRNIRVVQKTLDVNILGEVVTEEDLHAALENCEVYLDITNEEIVIDKIINFYIVDGNIKRDNVLNFKCNNLKINTSILITDLQQIKKYNDVFQHTKYNVSTVKCNVVCGNQIFLDNEERVSDYALIDVGAGMVDIGIFDRYNNIKNVFSVLLGGNNISNDLAICGEISFAEAEELKKMYSGKYKSLCEQDSINGKLDISANKLSNNMLYEVVSARIEEILNHINEELKKTGHYHGICSIILYGDGLSYFENINEIVQEIFKTKIKVVTGTDLGMKNSENITSMALAKEVYDRLTLFENDDMVPSIQNIKESEINEQEFSHCKESKTGVIKKVKNFLERIF